MTNPPEHSSLGWPGDMNRGFDPPAHQANLAGGVVHHLEMRVATLQEQVTNLSTQRDLLRTERDDWKETATVDSLTGLGNRLAVTRELDELTETEPGQFALMFIDLDGLKKANDEGGHEAGNELLQRAADALRSSVRTRDTADREAREHDTEGHGAFRLSGDEFVVILKNVSNQYQLTAINDRILDNFKDAGVRASTGSAIHEPGQSSTDLIDMVDSLMYIDKSERRQQRQAEARQNLTPEQHEKLAEIESLLGQLAMTPAELNNLIGDSNR